jgi:GxxExxY protein
MALANEDGLNTLTGGIIHSAIEVHRQLGPGLLESSYRTCLAYELRERGMTVGIELELPLRYKTVVLDAGYKLDVVVNSTVIVEVKAVLGVLPVHKAQLLTYLRLTGYPAGLLLNFNVPLMKNGVSRVLNTKTLRNIS